MRLINDDNCTQVGEGKMDEAERGDSVTTVEGAAVGLRLLDCSSANRYDA